MTRQEAIWHANHVFNIVIERCINAQNLKDAREFDEAKQIVIEALEQESSEDLISRQDVVTEIHKYFVEEIDKTPTGIDEDGDEVYTDMPTVNSLLACNKELSKRIKALSSAEPKRGEWVKKEHLVPLARDAEPLDWDKYDEKTHSELEEYWHCSECDYEGDRHFRPLWKYCPNCGARMESEE